MPDPLIATALVTAFKSADQWLGKARAEVKNTEKYNVSACVSYLEAARTAIGGLEDELDQIMIEAEQVAQHDPRQRPSLSSRRGPAPRSATLRARPSTRCAATDAPIRARRPS